VSHMLPASPDKRVNNPHVIYQIHVKCSKHSMISVLLTINSTKELQKQCNYYHMYWTNKCTQEANAI